MGAIGVKLSNCSRGVRSAQSGLSQKRSGLSSEMLFAIILDNYERDLESTITTLAAEKSERSQ